MNYLNRVIKCEALFSILNSFQTKHLIAGLLIYEKVRITSNDHRSIL